MDVKIGGKYRSRRVAGVEVEVVGNLGEGRWLVKYLNHGRWDWVGKEVETTGEVLGGWDEIKNIK